MAVILPVLGLSSSLKPLHSTHNSHRHTLTPSPSNSIAFPSQWRASASGYCRVRACRAFRRGEIGCELRELDVVSVEHCSVSGRTAEDVKSSVVRRAGGASALAVVGSLVSAGGSLADEIVASAVDGSDVGISTTVSVLFVVATVGLVVLTGGVVYLGLTEFLEKRALQEEQKKVEEAKPKTKPTKQAVKAAARAGGPKGFGSGKRVGSNGDDEEVSS